MLRVVLVDDEKLALDELSFILSKNSEIEIIGKYESPLAALEFIKKSEPEIVFLDVKMPEIDGFTLAKEINKLDFQVNIVFATVFDKYAIRAFEMNAIDYVLKPFSEKRLDLTMDKINEKYSNNKNALLKEKSIEGMIKIPLWKDECIYLVHPQDILYCTVLNKEVFVFAKEATFTTHDTLNQLANKLINHNFFRSHKSYLVNLDRIYKIVPWFNSTFVLQIEGLKEEVPVSRHYVKDFKKILNM
ncbi:LytR/AlgR family response regulator transcription factor [Clostridium lacusfryxellense]|uniref:LytR/AlgR family response regulator transcription factor n=1 Tax=Clostridium lacusfryxellense TaxID=205328 RepID=UPI001C0BBE99|nr:LytTR family DNA-binding domain-containing protein [Clostridium lacusfryxellense]MBU3113102.1 LytTR family DNA-binding domain-containing protein [Clostridium lacusfryxellense]